MSEEKKPSNEIRIGFTTKIKDVIDQCEKLLKDDKVKDLHLSAVANKIGDLVIVVEILKSMFPNISQKNVFTTVLPRQNEKLKNSETKSKRLFPRLEIILSLNKEEVKEEGSKSTISEEDRKILIDTLDEKKKALIKMRRFRNPFRNNRRWGYNRRGQRQRFAYSAKRMGYSRRRPTYNNRRPYGKTPDGRKRNFRKFIGTIKNSGNKVVAAKN